MNRRDRRDLTAVALSGCFVFAVAAFASFFVGIWTGDDRWGQTGAVLTFSAAALGFAALIASDS